MSKTQSIGTKIAFAFATVALGYALSTGIAALQNWRGAQKLGHLSTVAVPSAINAQTALFSFEAAHNAFEDSLVTGDRSLLDLVARHLAKCRQSVATNAACATNSFLRETHDGSLFATLDRVLTDYQRQYVPLFETVAAGTDPDAAQTRIAAFQRLSEEIHQSLEAFVAVETAELRLNLDSLEGTARSQLHVGLGLFGAVVFVGTGIVMWIVRRTVVRPMLRFSSDIRAEAEGVNSAVLGFEKVSQMLSTSAQHTAGALQLSTSTLQELGGVSRANCDRAQHAKDITTSSLQTADAGAAGMRELNGSMQRLQSSSREVEQIVRTIDEIAFQTNLLALNAAVEAARAGEAGAGFAVVADEVRRLAQRSADAAKDTAAKVAEAAHHSNQSASLSLKVARNLEEIAKRAHEVDDLVGQISSTSKDQAAGISQLAVVMTEIDDTTHKNATLGGQTAAAAQDLSQRTRHLRHLATALAHIATGGHEPAANESDPADETPPETPPLVRESTLEPLAA